MDKTNFGVVFIDGGGERWKIKTGSAGLEFYCERLFVSYNLKEILEAARAQFKGRSKIRICVVNPSPDTHLVGQAENLVFNFDLLTSSEADLMTFLNGTSPHDPF